MAHGWTSAFARDLIPRMRALQVYPYVMPLMSKKKQPFIIDENLSANLKPHLPADAKTTVECGVRKGTRTTILSCSIFASAKKRCSLRPTLSSHGT